MRGAVADGLHALEVVVGGLEAPVAPSPGAEAHEVDEGAERGELKEGPGRHVAGVLRVEARAVGALRPLILSSRRRYSLLAAVSDAM